MKTETTTTENRTPAVQQGETQATSLQQVRVRPEADVYRSKEAVRILMDVPGAQDRDIEVDVHNGILSVTARVERAEKEMRIYERSFRLNRNLNTQAVDAILQRGVLTLNVPFREEAQPKRITVKSA